jgi:hypothetical protein
MTSAIEGNAVASIRALIDERRWPIPDAARSDIATWSALQFLRVPRVRQVAREIAGTYIEVEIPFTSDTGERTTMRMQPRTLAAAESRSSSTNLDRAGETHRELIARRGQLVPGQQ